MNLYEMLLSVLGAAIAAVQPALDSLFKYLAFARAMDTVDTALFTIVMGLLFIGLPWSVTKGVAHCIKTDNSTRQ